MIQVHTKEFTAELIQVIRENGFGVTHYQGQGRDGVRYRLDVLVARTRMKVLRNLVEVYKPKAFLVAFDSVDFKGGYMLKGLQRPRYSNLPENDVYPLLFRDKDELEHQERGISDDQ
jgi:uncharacterized protein YebE (UPF0316 family)